MKLKKQVICCKLQIYQSGNLAGPLINGIQNYFHANIDHFMKHDKLVHNGGFPKFELLYCIQNTVKSTHIQ